jgi:hypothetical protein
MLVSDKMVEDRRNAADDLARWNSEHALLSGKASQESGTAEASTGVSS